MQHFLGLIITVMGLPVVILALALGYEITIKVEDKTEESELTLQ